MIDDFPLKGSDWAWALVWGQHLKYQKDLKKLLRKQLYRRMKKYSFFSDAEAIKFDSFKPHKMYGTWFIPSTDPRVIALRTKPWE